MTEEQKPQQWWSTVPGILTATAAIITAVTGLIVALHQAGVFGSGGKQPATTQDSTVKPAEAARGASLAGPPAASATMLPQAIYPRQLPAGAEVHFEGTSYKLLAAQLDRYNMEKLRLSFQVRMTNKTRYPANFWDASFRLLLDGVPRAPVSDLNKLVAGESADEGELSFVIPEETRGATLRVLQGSESTEIPIELAPVSGKMAPAQ